ncbi:MAG: hypothetical protein ABI298_03230 [Acidimicrobiales bacterium]
MKLISSKRRMAVVGLTVGLVAGAGGLAFAFFTASGSGTGSGAVGSAGAFTITSASPSGYLYPDTAGSNKNVESTDYTVTNSDGGNEVLSQVTISVAGSDGGTWSYTDPANDPACTAADFSIDGATPGTSVVDTSQAGTYSGGQSQTGSYTLEMIDNGQNQDSCQGLTVPIYFTTGFPSTGTVTGTDLSALTQDGPPPTLGSAGFYPNPTFLTVPTVTHGTPVSLTVTAIQPAQTADGAISVSYDNTFLTFTSATDGTCATPVTSGTTTTVSCTYSDLSHVESSKPFNFNTLKAGFTTATATVTVGANTATETFGLNLS